MRPILLSLIFCFSIPDARAEVRVAFLELRDSRGKLVQLEPGGRFAHLAISVGEKWLHAYPGQGVSFTTLEKLEKIGTVAEILVLRERAGLREGDAAAYLGKAYDRRFSWDDSQIYCSELVGKLLKLEPEPMSFQADHWKESPLAGQARGALGLSPDDIFRLLQSEAGERRPSSKRAKRKKRGPRALSLL